MDLEGDLMKVKIYGEVYQCERAVKGTNFVKLYDVNNNVIAYFSGIKDFAGYEIVDGNWSEAEKNDREKIEEMQAKLTQTQFAMVSLMNTIVDMNSKNGGENNV